MIQTKTCLYCGTPFIGTSFTCSRWDCPSKQIKTYTYCSPPCAPILELSDSIKALTEKLAAHEALHARQRMCDCEYLGICSDDPAKGEYCPLRKDAEITHAGTKRTSQTQAYIDGKPNPDRQCSLCGTEHEYRNLYHAEAGSICRACILYAKEWRKKIDTDGYYCTCCGAEWYPREMDAEGKAQVVCEECGKKKEKI